MEKSTFTANPPLDIHQGDTCSHVMLIKLCNDSGFISLGNDITYKMFYYLTKDNSLIETEDVTVVNAYRGVLSHMISSKVVENFGNYTCYLRSYLDEEIISTVSFPIVISKVHDYEAKSSEVVITKEFYDKLLQVVDRDQKLKDYKSDKAVKFIALPLGLLNLTEDIVLIDKAEEPHVVNSPAIINHKFENNKHYISVVSNNDIIVYEESNDDYKYNSLSETTISIDVDDELSLVSKNPVQNKVITKSLYDLIVNDISQITDITKIYYDDDETNVVEVYTAEESDEKFAPKSIIVTERDEITDDTEVFNDINNQDRVVEVYTTEESDTKLEHRASEIIVDDPSKITDKTQVYYEDDPSSNSVEVYTTDEADAKFIYTAGSNIIIEDNVISAVGEPPVRPTLSENIDLDDIDNYLGIWDVAENIYIYMHESPVESGVLFPIGSILSISKLSTGNYYILGLFKDTTNHLVDGTCTFWDPETLIYDTAKFSDIHDLYHQLRTKQDVLTAGEGISIIDNIISVTLDLSDYATLSNLSYEINNEADIRYNADHNLQQQIDAITVSTDVRDVVGTHADLEAYNTDKLNNDDIIKVLADETEDGATTYYRWIKIGGQTPHWSLIGEEGPYYTKSAADSRFVSISQKTADNNKFLKVVSGNVTPVDLIEQQTGTSYDKVMSQQVTTAELSKHISSFTFVDAVPQNPVIDGTLYLTPLDYPSNILSYINSAYAHWGDTLLNYPYFIYYIRNGSYYVVFGSQEFTYQSSSGFLSTSIPGLKMRVTGSVVNEYYTFNTLADNYTTCYYGNQPLSGISASTYKKLPKVDYNKISTTYQGNLYVLSGQVPTLQTSVVDLSPIYSALNAGSGIEISGTTISFKDRGYKVIDAMDLPTTSNADGDTYYLTPYEGTGAVSYGIACSNAVSYPTDNLPPFATLVEDSHACMIYNSNDNTFYLIVSENTPNSGGIDIGHYGAIGYYPQSVKIIFYSVARGVYKYTPGTDSDWETYTLDNGVLFKYTANGSHKRFKFVWCNDIYEGTTRYITYGDSSPSPSVGGSVFANNPSSIPPQDDFYIYANFFDPITGEYLDNDDHNVEYPFIYDMNLYKNGQWNVVGLFDIAKIFNKFATDEIVYKPSQVTLVEGATITLADNTIYTGTDIVEQTFQFPNGNFECLISLTTASSGTIAIDFPLGYKFIGTQPTFSNSQEWEISIRNGIVVACEVNISA